jgi:hypothetical protein
VAAAVAGLEIVAVHVRDSAVGQVAEGAADWAGGGVLDQGQCHALREVTLRLAAQVLRNCRDGRDYVMRGSEVLRFWSLGCFTVFLWLVVVKASKKPGALGIREQAERQRHSWGLSESEKEENQDCGTRVKL